MKISALKTQFILILSAILFAAVDVFLIVKYGFKGQLLIFIYCMIGCVSLCLVVSVIADYAIPKIIFIDNSESIESHFIANEKFHNDRLRNQHDVFYTKEIVKYLTERPESFISIFSQRGNGEKLKVKLTKEFNPAKIQQTLPDIKHSKISWGKSKDLPFFHAFYPPRVWKNGQFGTGKGKKQAGLQKQTRLFVAM